MKGIVLAGGTGSRLSPMTTVISKQLLPLYDKPMIYYPVSVLLSAGISEIAIITNSCFIDMFKKLLGDGSDYGVKFTYLPQDKPEGIAQAFIIAESFIKDDPVCLILGDNIFYGESIDKLLVHGTSLREGAVVCAYYVKDPHRYGIVEFDANDNPVSIVEKPSKTNSNYAVTGLYFYDNKVVQYSKALKPSPRGELEITDLNMKYLEAGKLDVIKIKRGMAWLDTGTAQSLHEASSFVETIQNRQGLMVACLEEIAYEKGLINLNKIEQQSKKMKPSSYGEYLDFLANKIKNTK